MPAKPWTNLSLEAKRYEKMRRDFVAYIKTNDTFTSWIVNVIEGGIYRYKYLQRTFPHLKIIQKLGNILIIEDTKNNKVVKVEWKGGKAVCNEKGDEYVIFASLHPEFKLV